MNLAFDRLKVYVRLGLVVFVVAVIALVLVKNRAHDVPVWCFGLTDVDKPVNVVWLMLSTAGATLISWWVLSFGWGLLRDLRKVRLETAKREAARAAQEREARLDERERRIDEKLREAITAEGDEGGEE